MPSYSKQIAVPGKSSQDIYRRVSEELPRFLEKTPIGKYDLTQNDAKKTVSVVSSLFNATISCEDGAIRLNGTLSFMAAPFKGKLDEGLERWVSKAFSS